MEEVETAAADTTSEHSSSPRPQHYAHAYQPGHMTTPNYPSKMTGTPLSFSDHHHHGQPSTWEARNTQLASGRDLDDSYEFESGAPPYKRQRIENIGDQSSQMSPETSVHVRRHHGDRPVGIAQPMQLQDTQQTEPSLSLSSASKEETELQEKSKTSHFTPQQHISAANPSAQVPGQPAPPVTVAVKSQQSQSSGTLSDHESSSGAQTDLVMSQDNRSTLNYLSEVYDSDQSQESQRFDKFINESSKNDSACSTERLSLSDKQFELLQESTASSETSSESTTQFIATYVTPNMKYLDSDMCIESSTNQSDVKSQDSPPHQYEPPPSETIPGIHVSVEQPFEAHVPVHGSGLTEEELHHPLGHDLEKDCVSKSSRRSSLHLPSAQLVQSGLPLPPNKKWHLFVSHSTSSQDWARDTIVARLTGSAHLMRVAACYQSMPDQSRYDHKEIWSRMRESCAILIAITPLYLKSERCKKEWELAVRLCREGRQCDVIVAALEVCSRPTPLKQFLYLDFIDRSKFDAVWGKLLEEIHNAVQRMLPPISSPHQDIDDAQNTNNDDQDIFSQEIAPIGGGERRSSTSTDPSSHRSGNLHLELPKSGSTQSTTTSDVIMTSSSEDPHLESYHQHWMADFEAMYEEMGEDNSQSEGERHAHGDIADPRPSKMVDLSSTHELVSQVLQEERGGEVAVVESSELMDGSGLLDVEEGELSSNSSDEMGGVKRKRSKKNESEVAKFYNKLAQPDADRRDESPIFYMRNFNNWVKSILIRTHLPEGATVLDLCCGKGGDMLKWKEGGIDYLICADISEDSVRVCEKERYHSDKMIMRSTGRPPFDAEFIVADCCEVRLRDRYLNPARRFHVTSCQFSVHYSFESYRRAHMMLRNACENLRPGGFFIGTTVDSNEVVHRLRKAGQNKEGLWSIGNDIFTVTLDPSLDINHLPLFGARYNFKLHGVVDLPEFLVHFPLLVDMLKDFDMELVLHQNFYDFFTERRYNTDDIQLLHRMKAFNPRRGTMSNDEWEAIGLYLVFVFRKRERDRLREYS